MTLNGNMSLGGDFTTLNNPVSINAVGSSRNIILNENLTINDGSDIILQGASGGTKTVSLGGNLTTLNNNVTINADTTNRILTLSLIHI